MSILCEAKSIVKTNRKKCFSSDLKIEMAQLTSAYFYFINTIPKALISFLNNKRNMILLIPFDAGVKNTGHVDCITCPEQHTRY